MQDYDEDEIQGSKFIFYLLRVVNVVMMVLGAIVVVASVYVYLLLECFTIIDVAMVGIGAFIFAIGYSSVYLRHSLVGISLYLFVTLAYLLCQLIACMVFASMPEKVVDYIVSKSSQSVKSTITAEVEGHVKTLQYLMGAMLVATVSKIATTRGRRYWT